MPGHGPDGSFLVKADYWITDHRSRAYDLKEEIKNQGGRWSPEFKAWKLVGKDIKDPSLSVLKSAGLGVQLIPGSERKYE